MKCKICNKDVSLNDIRFGICWNCAEAESIISEGVDMDDNGLLGKPAKTAMQKLELLIVKGWRR